MSILAELLAIKHSKQIQELSSNKISAGQVTVSDIDITKGKFDETFMSESFLQQMAGTTPVNPTPPDESVTLQKLAFTKKSTNLYNPSDMIADAYVDIYTGTQTASASFNLSGWIPIKASTKYFIKYARHICYYNPSKAFISSESGTSAKTNYIGTSPANARYMRVSWNKGDATSDQQINEGNAQLAYEPYYIYIDKDYIEQYFDTGMIADGSLTIKKMEFSELGKNLFDKSLAELNKTINTANGITYDASDFAVSGFIEIEPDTPYCMANVRKCVFYDANKVFLTGQSPASPFTNIVLTSPSTAKYMRLSWYLSNLALELQMVNKGSQPAPFETHGYRIKSSALDIKLPTEYSAEMVLPPKIYALVGQELNIYFDNIMNDKDTKYDFDVTCSVGKQFETCYRVTPDTAGEYAITIKALKDGAEKAVATSTIVVAPASAGSGVTRKIIVIGDSTTAGGQTVEKLLANYLADVMNVTSLGTQGTAPNVQEGRSGWTANQYVTQATDNAFWNTSTNKFDFSYYIAQRGYTGVARVIINLGINDMFNHTTDPAVESAITTALSAYQTIINSIHAYDSTIEIGIAVTIPPCYSQDAFGMSYNCGQTRWRYKRNNFLWAKALINQFKNKEANNIYLVPINTNLDTRNNFPYDGTTPVNARNTETVKNFATNAGVHPATSGYWQIADVYWYWLKALES